MKLYIEEKQVKMEKKEKVFSFQDSKDELFHKRVSEERVIVFIVSICLSFAFYGFYFHDHYGLDAYGMF